MKKNHENENDDFEFKFEKLQIDFDLENSILGALISKPYFLELVPDLKASDFNEDYRQIFEAIVDIYEDTRPDEIDLVILNQKTNKGNIIKKLVNQYDFVGPEFFVNRVSELKKRRLFEAILRDSQKVSRLYLKTNVFDEEGVEKLINDVDKLKTLKSKSVEVEPLGLFAKKALPDKEILIDPILREGELVVFAGFPKLGKSIFALNLAIKLAVGRDFLGFPILKNKRTIVFQNEVSENFLRERIKKLIDSIDCLADLENSVFFVNKSFNIIDDFGLIKKIIDSKENIGLVIFDPLINFHNCRENDASEMTQVLNCFREVANLGPAVLVIHHFSKAIEGRQGGYQGRGSSVIASLSDSNFQFERPNPSYWEFKEEDLSNFVQLSFEVRNTGLIKPKLLKLNENLWFSAVNVEKKIKLIPWDIVEVVEQNGGEIPRSELERLIRQRVGCSHRIFHLALKEAERENLIEEVQIEGSRGRGLGRMIRLRS